MKRILLLLTCLALVETSAWAQTSTTTGSTGSTGTTTSSAGNGELRAKLQAMTPDQRREFLENHPRLREQVRDAAVSKYEGMTPAQQQQFAQSHPQLAQRLQNVSEAGSSSTDPGHPRVNEVNGRETKQGSHIQQGVNSGQLTPGEDNHLQRGEARVQNQEANDMAKHDGHLTKPEDWRLNHEENRLNRQIYRDKHNDRTAPTPQ